MSSSNAQPSESLGSPSNYQHTDLTSNAQSQTNKGRVIILCFDGTGNKFGANSNIVRFFRALVKHKDEEQIVYYQPGIGTYNKRAFITHTASTIASSVDSAIALHIDDHVKEGYQFIVQNYRRGDKLSVFGFSRGAHTARVVAGMVYKVGILPKENIQQLDFGFNMYSTTGYNGYKLSQEFKRTFTASTCDTIVDFVGVWDTVSSVGIIPKMHPYTSVNYAVKKFRHALSLDERRARFRPNVWSEITLAREQELDVDIPVHNIEEHPLPTNRDNYTVPPPDRDFADVKEVWFAGTHADVGGGSHPAIRPTSLSYIPLRWIIEECILCETGILFDFQYLLDALDFDFYGIVQKIDNEKKADRIKYYSELQKYAKLQLDRRHEGKDPISSIASDNKSTTSRRYVHDIVDTIFDQLTLFWYFWWLLEVIPMLYTFQDHRGDWIRQRMRNFGRGRYIPVSKNGKVLVHRTVEERIGGHKGEKIIGVFAVLMDRFWPSNKDKYTPRAYNWHYLRDNNLIEYVD